MENRAVDWSKYTIEIHGSSYRFAVAVADLKVPLLDFVLGLLTSWKGIGKPGWDRWLEVYRSGSLLKIYPKEEGWLATETDAKRYDTSLRRWLSRRVLRMVVEQEKKV